MKISKILPNKVKSFLKRGIRRNSWKGTKQRIFCISMQRSGTTSVGDFFRYFKYPTAGYRVKRSGLWTKYWYEGDFESIFRSKEFLSFQVFEDNPWWSPEFYKVLYHRFPNAKFILLTRNSDDWFKSMLKHSNQKTLGNTKMHCKIYRRESEFYNAKDKNIDFIPHDSKIDNLLSLVGKEDHYKDIYQIRNREIIKFFEEKNPKALYYGSLYDEGKWKKIGEFVGLKVPIDFDIHSNKSK